MTMISGGISAKNKNAVIGRHGMSYRSEIDGLRALAVIPVIFFHAGFKIFSGGYVGVDIFFVISGYLITSNIMSDLRDGKFSIARFYERRIRRILPALFFIMAACIVMAWFLVMPADFKDLSQSLIAVPLFLSNILFYFTSGYFDTASEHKPLLHTWSLGVEEQFYILFPLYLWAIFKFGLKKTVLGIVVFFVLSFACSEIMWRSGEADTNFFFTPSRAWELLFGSLCALLPAMYPIQERAGPAIKNIFAAVGIVMIVLAIVLFRPDTPSPSFYTLLPVVGAGLIILFATKETWVSRLLSIKLAVGIGLISYSAYLWHQPIFAFARLRSVEELSHADYFCLIAITLALAILTWRFVERPFRAPGYLSQKRIFVLAAIGSALMIGVGVAGIMCNGFPSRIPENQQLFIPYFETKANGRYVSSRFKELHDDFPAGSTRKKALIVGDSFAEDFVNIAFESGSLRNYDIRTFRIPSRCQIYAGQEPADNFIDLKDQSLCQNADNLDKASGLISRADVVIFVSSWKKWSAERLPETIQSLNLRANQKLIVVGRKSFGAINLRKIMDVPAPERISLRSPIAKDHIEINQIMRTVLPPEVFVDTYGILCEESKECPLFTPEGKLISYDGSHLTKDGAAFVGKILFKAPALAAINK